MRNIPLWGLTFSLECSDGFLNSIYSGMGIEFVAICPYREIIYQHWRLTISRVEEACSITLDMYNYHWLQHVHWPCCQICNVAVKRYFYSEGPLDIGRSWNIEVRWRGCGYHSSPDQSSYGWPIDPPACTRVLLFVVHGFIKCVLCS